MKIWQLSPLDPDSPDWCNSDYQGDAIIRAEDEQKARHLAVLAFLGFAEQVSSCQKTPRSPWDNPAATQCIELDNSEYPTDGLAKVLKAEGFDIQLGSVCNLFAYAESFNTQTRTCR